MVDKPKEEWKKIIEEYCKDKEGQTLTVKEICSFYGAIPKNLEDAYNELKTDKKLIPVIDKEGKEWVKSNF